MKPSKMKPGVGEQPIEPEQREVMNDIAEILSGALNPDGKKVWGFALMVFKFGQGDDHRCNYISNAGREDMLATMKEFIERAEGRFVEHG